MPQPSLLASGAAACRCRSCGGRGARPSCRRASPPPRAYRRFPRAKVRPFREAPVCAAPAAAREAPRGSASACVRRGGRRERGRGAAPCTGCGHVRRCGRSVPRLFRHRAPGEVGPERFGLDPEPGCRIADGSGGILPGNACGSVASSSTPNVHFRRRRASRAGTAPRAKLSKTGPAGLRQRPEASGFSPGRQPGVRIGFMCRAATPVPVFLQSSESRVPGTGAPERRRTAGAPGRVGNRLSCGLREGSPATSGQETPSTDSHQPMRWESRLGAMT